MTSTYANRFMDVAVLVIEAYGHSGLRRHPGELCRARHDQDSGLGPPRGWS